jgi:hypothetical protein
MSAYSHGTAGIYRPGDVGSVLLYHRLMKTISDSQDLSTACQVHTEEVPLFLFTVIVQNQIPNFLLMDAVPAKKRRRLVSIQSKTHPVAMIHNCNFLATACHMCCIHFYVMMV